MIKRLLLLTLLAVPVISFSQLKYGSSEKLIGLKDLNFQSKEERVLFDTIVENNDIYCFKLALQAKFTSLNDSVSKYLATYNDFISELDNAEFSKLKEEKKIKLIYKKVHARFFKKYELKAEFEDIFTTGNYNCVTATLLYSIIFKRFNVPHQIKETSEHVFVVAYPQSKSISVESTDPFKGYMVYDKEYKQKFVEYLKNQKMVTNVEVLSYGIDSVFNKFYFSEKNINAVQLIGLQYYNNGAYIMEDDKNKEALGQFMKSYYLYPSEKTKFLIYNNLLNLLVKTDYFNQADWYYFTLLPRFAGSIFTIDNYRDEYSRILNKLLVERSDLERTTKSYNYIIANLNDTALQRQISYVYNFELGRYHLAKDDYKNAYPCFERAYICQPNNYVVQNLFFETFMTYTTKSNVYKSENEFIDTLDHIYSKYENFHSLNKFMQIYLWVHLYKASDCYDLQNFKEGDRYLSKFETLKQENPDVEMDAHLMIDVYIKPAAYYFKQNNKVKAREYINRGLKIMPDNVRLKNSLKMMQ